MLAETQEEHKNNNPPAKKSPNNYTENFERFWAVYPKKVGKADAAKSFKKAEKVAEAEKIIEAAKAYCETKQVKDGFICNPATWLNQERWLDEVKPQKPVDPIHSNPGLRGF